MGTFLGLIVVAYIQSKSDITIYSKSKTNKWMAK